METETEICGACGGEGKTPKAQDIVPAAVPPEVEFETCPVCSGKGVLPKLSN
jgi:DnaJ-class molecular chaperone